MKFLCVECDEVMSFAERQLPGDGTMAAVFACGACGREMAMLTNPMETRLVSSMGVKVGGRDVPEQPMELTRTSLEGARPEAFEEEETSTPGASAGQEASPGPDAPAGSEAPPAAAAPGPRTSPPSVGWSEEAAARLQLVPRFVRGMVKRIYTDWARERGITTITPEIMDRARSELGLEGM